MANLNAFFLDRLEVDGVACIFDVDQLFTMHVNFVDASITSRFDVRWNVLGPNLVLTVIELPEGLLERVVLRQRANLFFKPGSLGTRKLFWALFVWLGGVGFNCAFSN